MEDKSLESLRTEILSLSKEYFAKNKKDLFIPEISKIPVSGKVLDEKDIENLNNDLNNYLWKKNSYIKNDIYGHLHFLNFIYKNKISDKKILKRFNIV